MPIQNKSNLRTWFSTFKYPTQSQFWDWLDSYWHKLEKIPVNMIDGLTELLSGFASSAALNNHANDKNNPHNVTATQVGAASTSDLLALETDISTNTNNITTLETELQGIQQELAEKEHFRGYFTTSAQIQALASPKDGDFAYNAETGTKWTYFNSSWGDTGEAVPDQVTPKTTTTPLMDGTAAVGDENAYAPGNHRHPTDTTRAASADLQTETQARQTADTALQTQINANKYTLPTATYATRGGVKVGNGLNSSGDLLYVDVDEEFITVIDGGVLSLQNQIRHKTIVTGLNKPIWFPMYYYGTEHIDITTNPYTFNLDYNQIKDHLRYDFGTRLGTSVVPTLNIGLSEIITDNSERLFAGFSIKIGINLASVGLSGTSVCREMDINFINDGSIYSLKEHASMEAYRKGNIRTYTYNFKGPSVIGSATTPHYFYFLIELQYEGGVYMIKVDKYSA